MENLNQIAEAALGALKKNGAQKAQVDVSSAEVHELNVEAGRLTLLRTTFDQGVGLRAIVDHKQSTMSGNQFVPADLQSLAEQTVDAAKTSAVDEAFDIAPTQAPQKFESGPMAGNTELLTERTEDLLKEVKQRFPKIILEAVTVQFVKRQRVLANSNGVHFQFVQGDYEASVMFTAKDGKKTSSFNYTGFSTTDFSKPILEFAEAAELLRQSEEQTEMQSIPGKFTGDIIITPHCLPSFIEGVTSHLQTGSLLKRQSMYQDKLGQKVATEKFSLRCQPRNSEFSWPGFVTGDGFLAENVDVIDRGVLKTFLLGQYGSNKLKQARTKSDNGYHIVDPGQASVKDMIRNVKKGILLCRFSGGNPASNGDVSGVAKNSYYIENGEILFPVGECMISGNIPDMFMQVLDVSRETVNFGNSKLPWVHCAGLTISGK